MVKAITSHFAFSKILHQNKRKHHGFKNESVVFFLGKNIIIFLCCILLRYKGSRI